MLPQITNELTKTQIKIIADNLVYDLLESGDIIKMADTVSKLEFFIKELKSNDKYIDYLRHEVGKFGQSHITSTGTKIELAEVGVKYDYTQCGDLQIFQIMHQIADLENKLKERQNFLKSLPLSGVEVVDENAEVIKLYPPSKSSTSSIKCTIQK
jgi:hypothetical protein